MIKHYFRFICLAFGIATIVGCSNNGLQPISLNEKNNPLTAKVGTNGASFVSQCANFTMAVGKDTWSNGAHKIFIFNGTTWLALAEYSSIDAWKVAYDVCTSTLWILARNNTLWKNLEQQMFYPGPNPPKNNTVNKSGPILAYDLTLAQSVDEYGSPIGIPYILLNETGSYGYITWRQSPSSHYWDQYYGSVEGSGVAIAANPNPPSDAHSGDLWIVRNTGELMLWNCDNMRWVKIASNCPKTFGKADVSVAADNSIYYFNNTVTGSDYKINISADHGATWVERGSGISLGASNKGWTVNAAGNIYNYTGKLVNGSYWKMY